MRALNRVEAGWFIKKQGCHELPLSSALMM